MITLKNDKVFFSDVDETLILWDTSEYPNAKKIRFKTKRGNIVLTPHQKNINLLIKFAKLGYAVIVWSKSGYEWSERICKELKITKYVTLCTSKPNWYLDDQPCQNWLGDRIWRDPITGKPQK